uniref:Uncharacterized protein n=1 Tax=Candidatus Kentrum sp. TC TaxID=2126339 RepID=A0A451AGW6_9GAMM|nr:MAG: hypothetical protein BECKTC1821E_GA0114239_11672 [Candidatus Kentron sp. TC]VFK65287.1 MAG: hypothetical protein BECKTC1821F_GA0114240_11763 [Candidatus Kentron sp. TC]
MNKFRRRQCTRKGFTRKYTDADIRLLARTDELHGRISGPATKKLCERGMFARTCGSPTCWFASMFSRLSQSGYRALSSTTSLTALDKGISFSPGYSNSHFFVMAFRMS